MEALAVLRLSVSPRRHNHGLMYLEEDDVIEEMALPTPYTSAPSSPRRGFSKEVVEAPLGEVRAAVPFAWELIPGTPKHDLESSHGREVCVSSEEAEETVDRGSSSSSSVGESLSRESSNTEFEFSSRFGGVAEPALPSCAAPSMSTAEELFSNGQLVTSSLRLPPRLQAVKHLRNSDSSCSDVSSSDSFKSYQSPQSPQSPVTMKLSLCGFTKTTEEEPIILGMQERKHRSLSPLRFFNRESFGSTGSETYFSNSSVSSSSSSSSSGGETNAGSPQEKSVQSSTLKELLFTDMAMASERSENLKGVAKPRQVQSKLELLKKEQEHWNCADAGRPALTPQLSRSNARSRPAPSLAIDIRANSLRKENMGRAILANRVGMLCSCLGILPESP